jgi:hypothetical protein
MLHGSSLFQVEIELQLPHEQVNDRNDIFGGTKSPRLCFAA